MILVYLHSVYLVTYPCRSMNVFFCWCCLESSKRKQAEPREPGSSRPLEHSNNYLRGNKKNYTSPRRVVTKSSTAECFTRNVSIGMR